MYIKDLKKKYHIGNETIHKVLESNGVRLKSKIYQDEENKIVEEYKVGASIAELSNKYGHKETTISKILLKNGIEYTKCAFSKRLRQLTEEQIKTLLEEYQNGASLMTINKKYRLNHEAIKKLLRQNNIKVRDPYEAAKIGRRKYNADFDFFTKPSRAMWYIIGFVAADGNIATYSNSLDISLAQKDGKLLEDIKKYLQFTGSVKYFETSHGDDKARLTITDKKMIEDLAKYNIHRAKTFDFLVPDCLPREYRRDFLLGYFDGDGSVSKEGNQVTIVSVQKPVLETFLQWLKEENILGGNIGIDKRNENKKTLYYLNFSRREEVAKIYHYFYDNLEREDLFLKRKKERFENNCFLK